MKKVRTESIAVVVGLLVIEGTLDVIVGRRRTDDRPGWSLPAPSESPVHAVLIHIRLSNGAFGSPDEVERLQALEMNLEDAIARAGVGELDGNEIGAGEYVIFTYGPDADRLFGAIEPLLRAQSPALAGHVVKRYGDADDPDARETRLEL